MNGEDAVVKDLQALSLRSSRATEDATIEGTEQGLEERIVLPAEVTDAQDALDWICDQSERSPCICIAAVLTTMCHYVPERLTLPILQLCRTLPGIQILELEDEDPAFLAALERVEGSEEPHWPDLDTIIL